MTAPAHIRFALAATLALTAAPRPAQALHPHPTDTGCECYQMAAAALDDSGKRSLYARTAGQELMRFTAQWVGAPVPLLQRANVTLTNDAATYEELGGAPHIAAFTNRETGRIVFSPKSSRGLLAVWLGRPMNPTRDQIWSAAVAVHEFVHLVSPPAAGAMPSLADRTMEEGIAHEIASKLTWKFMQAWVPQLPRNPPDDYFEAVAATMVDVKPDGRFSDHTKSDFAYAGAIGFAALAAKFMTDANSEGEYLRKLLAIKARTPAGGWRASFVRELVRHRPACKRQTKEIGAAFDSAQAEVLSIALGKCLGADPDEVSIKADPRLDRGLPGPGAWAAGHENRFGQTSPKNVEVNTNRPERGHVKLYAAKWCGWCKKMVRALAARGVDYEYIDVKYEADGWHLKLRDPYGRFLPRAAIPVLVVNGLAYQGYSEWAIARAAEAAGD